MPTFITSLIPPKTPPGIYTIAQSKEWAWKEVGDRLDPKPRRVEISGPDGGPIQVDDRAAADLEVKLGSFLKAVRRKEPVTVEAEATRLP